MLLLGAFAACCLAHAAAVSDDDLFDTHEVVTGPASSQTVLAGFFLGGSTADLAVLQIGRDGRRHLKMYGFGGDGWAPLLEAQLSPGALFVDVANLGGRDRIVTYETGRLSWFDPDSATLRPLLSIATSYNATGAGEIPHLDIMRDLNRDGRDDLLLPDLDGFWIAIQLGSGSFAEPLLLGPPEPFLDERGLVPAGFDESRSYRDVGITPFTLPLYLSRVHETDHDQDERSDLVFWNGSQFDVYHQAATGLFDRTAEAVDVSVPFASDGVYSRLFDFSEVGAISELFGFNQNSSRTVLHSLEDLNGDRAPDLMTLTLTGRRLAKQRSLYEVHFGTPTPEGISFASDAGTAIHRRGKAAGVEAWGYSSRLFEDFDSDGDIDVMFRDIRTGIGGMGRALLANSVAIDLEFYRFEDGGYPDEPTEIRRVRPALRPFSGRQAIFLPAALIGDVNGDGRSDLLLAESRAELQLFYGQSGPNLFARQPRTLPVRLPTEQERNVRLVDLNADGKQDLLIHHPSESEPHRLVLMIAR